MGTNCASLVADLFNFFLFIYYFYFFYIFLIYLFIYCYERDFMKSFSRKNQGDIIQPFNSTLRYLDDLLNI